MAPQTRVLTVAMVDFWVVVAVLTKHRQVFHLCCRVVTAGMEVVAVALLGLRLRLPRHQRFKVRAVAVLLPSSTE